MDAKTSETCSALLQLLINILLSCISLVLYIYSYFIVVRFKEILVLSPCGWRHRNVETSGSYIKVGTHKLQNSAYVRVIRVFLNLS